MTKYNTGSKRICGFTWFVMKTSAPQITVDSCSYKGNTRVLSEVHQLLIPACIIYALFTCNSLCDGGSHQSIK